MKNLNEMTAKELKEIAKNMKISNWWNLKKEVLIKKIEAVQALTEEEKQEIADQKAKEDAAIAEYTKNWNKYTKRYNIAEFIEKWKSGEIILESEAQEEPEVEEIQEEEKPVEQPAVEESTEEKPKKKKSVEEVEPFVYTDTDGEEYEDYDIGEMISKWSEEKKAAFTQWFNEEFIGNGGLEAHDEDELNRWSAAWDAEHPVESKEKKEGHKPTPKRGALIEWDGRAQNICAWGKELGISPNTLYGRIYKMGWSVQKAFTTKPR